MSAVRRRRFPWPLLFVAFLVVPIVEIYVLIQVGHVIGAWWTVLLLIADSIFGSSIPDVQVSGSESFRSGGRLLLLARAGCRAVQVGRADLTAAEQLETLGEDVLQLADRAALEQHVPVRADRLLGLLLRLDARDAEGVGAAARALPGGRHLRLDRHRDLEGMAPGALVADLLPRSELDAALVLEALSAEAGSS
jgi:hypothetical protein